MRSNNVTQLVIGKARRGRIAEFLRPSLVHALLREGAGPAIHVLPADAPEGASMLARLRLRPDERHPVPYMLSALAVAVSGLAAKALDYWLDLQTLSLVFLVGVLFYWAGAKTRAEVVPGTLPPEITGEATLAPAGD